MTKRRALYICVLPVVLLIVLGFVASGGNPDNGDRWEYKYYLPDVNVCDNSNNKLVDGLNALGHDGWEVVTFNPAGAESRTIIIDRDQNNARATMGQSVTQYATTKSKVTGCPLLLKKRFSGSSSAQ